ncbi:MAG TPA: DUF2461 domain-containing protein [Flavobacteriales bacterium]|nr:DUF2461 domain-containing protein [Flavobacteriales bacterium]
MKSPIIKQTSLDFLKKIAKNNNRDWFNKHKDEYLMHRENLIDFADALLIKLNQHDHIETDSGKKSLFRIYKDVRFSKDKTPYNTHWSGFFKRATKKRRGSYYFHLKPGDSYVIIGFWGPNPDDMKRIRKEIHLNPEGWEKVLENKTFKRTFGEMKGEKLSSAPRGYEKDHPGIELLRYKQYLLKHVFTDKQVLAKDFVAKVSDVFKKARPFLDFMSETLTTNADGESLVD